MRKSEFYLNINQSSQQWFTVCLLWLAFSLAGFAQPNADCDNLRCVQLQYKRMPDGFVPDAEALTTPSFSPQSGVVAYGDKVRLSAPSVPTGAVMEYSYDNGKTWTAGTEATITTQVDLLARIRLNDVTSSSTKASFKPFFKRMLVVGNSIMSHGPAPDLGWFNFNGMAASAPEKDFVHLLTAQLAQLYPQINVRLQSGGGFEREFGKPTYSFDEFNEAIQDFKADLIIVRIGENMSDWEVQSRNLELQFRLLLEKLATSSPSTKIVCTTSVWDHPQADAVARKVTAEKGYPLVDLSSMVNQRQYFASQYADPGVAAHPNDAGMQRIADLIWEKVK